MTSPTVLDTETCLIAPALQSPPIVCCTTYHPSDGARLWPTARVAECFERVLSSGPVLGQNISFDLRAAAAWHPHLRPLIWASYEAGRVWDTRIAQRIIEIQRGDARTDLGLSMLGRLYGVDVPDKSDEATRALRLSFGQYYGADSVSPAHAEYALGDAWAPHPIFERQMASGLVSHRDLTHLGRQDFWLGLVSGWGFRTDPARVTVFAQRVAEHLEYLDGIAREHGFLRPDGSKNTKVIKAAVCQAYAGLTIVPEDFSKSAEQALVAQILAARKEGQRHGLAAIPLSDSEKSIGTDKIVREDALDHEGLQDLATWGQWQATRDKDLPLLMRGAVEPVHSKFGIANTARSTASPNQQNWAKGHRPDPTDPLGRHRVWGVRETLAARPGLGIVTTDAKGLENCALAQCIVWRTGRREYADKINSGRDPLSECGAHIVGLDYDEFVRRRKAGDEECDDARSASKPAVYGMSGGMSKPETLRGYARRGYGLSMTLEQTERVAAANRALMYSDGRQAWLDSAESLRNDLGRYDVPLCPQLTDLVRRGVSRTDACNNPFQFVGAYVMSLAGWAVCRGQYLTGECPAHLSGFVHDSLDSEAHPDDGHEVAAYQERAIAEAGQTACPDVRWAGESRMLSHQSKSARATYVDGRLALTEVPL